MDRRWAGLAVAAAALAVGLPTTAASAATISDPAQNVVPSPAYWQTCVQQGTSSQQCTDAIVAAIDNARALEGVGPMTLPANFATLTPAQQTFVVTNLERVDRGLAPAVGMVDSLNSLATDAAKADADPMLPGWTVGSFQVNGWSSIWAGDLNALASDYDWMYDDGWGPQGSYNLDCTSATASGCWGHRHAILRSGSHLITGVGSDKQSSWMSIAQILVSGSGTLPAFTYSWADVTGAAPTAPAPGSVTATVTAPTATVAGRTVRVVGTLTDATSGAPVAGAAVLMCRQSATAAVSICTSLTTDDTGTVTMTDQPQVSTGYWLSFAGTDSTPAVESAHTTVGVRPALSVRSTAVTGARRTISAAVSPAQGQTLRLRRWTASGWTTVRRTTATPSVTFDRVRLGAYRLVVSKTVGTLRSVATFRLS